MLYRVVLTFKSVDKTLVCDKRGSPSNPLLCVTIQMKATEQYFHVVLFVMLYKVVLTCKSVGEILACVYYVVQDF